MTSLTPPSPGLSATLLSNKRVEPEGPENAKVTTLWTFKVAIATKVLKQRHEKNIYIHIYIVIEANIINNSAKFQLYPPYSF